MAIKRVPEMYFAKYYRENIFFVREFSATAYDVPVIDDVRSDIHLFHEIFDRYAAVLENALKSKNLSIINSVLIETGKRRERGEVDITARSPYRYYDRVPIDGDKFMQDDFSSLSSAINNIIYLVNYSWPFIKDDKDIVDAFDNAFEDYVVTKAGIDVIYKFKKSNEYDSISGVLRCMSALMRLDMMKISAFTCAENVWDSARSFRGRQDSIKTHAHRQQALYFMENEARERWKNGDQLLHHKMVSDLAVSVNEEYRRILVEEYALRRDNSKTPDTFQKEIDKLNARDIKKDVRNGKGLIAKKTLLEYIRPIADEYGKLFDPGGAYKKKIEKG